MASSHHICPHGSVSYLCKIRLHARDEWWSLPSAWLIPPGYSPTPLKAELLKHAQEAGRWEVTASSTKHVGICI